MKRQQGKETPKPPLSYQMLKNVFLEAEEKREKKKKPAFGIAGIPFDGTLTYKPGARFAPDEIRQASWSMETFSPFLKKDLADKSYIDWGNLEVPYGDTPESLRLISSLGKDASFHKMVFLGGEHLITFPLFSSYLEKYPDLCLIQLDAHADLRFEYLDNIYSHATVMHHCVDKISPQCFFQIGIRSGTRREFQYIEKYDWLYFCQETSLREMVQKIGEKPVYLTIDVDVFDPSFVPGTGTPEPGGLNWEDYERFLSLTAELDVKAFDVVEVSPPYDPSGISAVFAARIIRETILNFWY